METQPTQPGISKTREIILTAIATTVFGLFVYLIQFNDTKQQAFYEHKLSAMEKYIKDANTLIYYARYRDWVLLRIAKQQIEKSGKTRGFTAFNLAHPFKYIDSCNKDTIGCAIINDDQTDILVKGFHISDTGRYKLYEKAKEFMSQYRATYLSTKNFFNDSIKVPMDTLDTWLQPDYYHRLIKADLLHVRTSIIDDSTGKVRIQKLELIVKSMRGEIDKEKDRSFLGIHF